MPHSFGEILRSDFAGLRDELIISSKAGYDLWPGPYGEWGSRTYLIASCDQSLKRLGLDYVEGGWPGANPTDSDFFAQAPKLTHAKFLAFGMTKRAGRSAANDEVLAEVVNAGTGTTCPTAIDAECGCNPVISVIEGINRPCPSTGTRPR